MDNEDQKPENIYHNYDRVSMYNDTESTQPSVSTMRLETAIQQEQFTHRTENNGNRTFVSTFCKQEDFTDRVDFNWETRRNDSMVRSSETSLANVTRTVNNDTCKDNNIVIHNKYTEDSLQGQNLLQTERDVSVMSCKTAMLDLYSNLVSSEPTVVDSVVRIAPMKSVVRNSVTELGSSHVGHQGNVSISMSSDSVAVDEIVNSVQAESPTVNDNVIFPSSDLVITDGVFNVSTTKSVMGNTTASFQIAGLDSSFNMAPLQPAGKLLDMYDMANITSSKLLLSDETTVTADVAHFKEEPSTLPACNRTLHVSKNALFTAQDIYKNKRLEELDCMDSNENDASQSEPTDFDEECEYSDNICENIGNNNGVHDMLSKPPSRSGNTNVRKEPKTGLPKTKIGNDVKIGNNIIRVKAPLLSRKRKYDCPKGEAVSCLKDNGRNSISVGHMTMSLHNDAKSDYSSTLMQQKGSWRVVLERLNKESSIDGKVDGKVNDLRHKDYERCSNNRDSFQLNSGKRNNNRDSFQLNSGKRNRGIPLSFQNVNQLQTKDRYKIDDTMNYGNEEMSSSDLDKHNHDNEDTYEMYVTDTGSGSNGQTKRNCDGIDTNKSRGRSCKHGKNYSHNNSSGKTCNEDSDSEHDDFDDRLKKTSAKSDILCNSCPEYRAKDKREMLRHEITTSHLIRRFGYSALETKKHECNVCSSRFTNKHSLTYHYKNQHGKYVAEGDTVECTLCNQYRNVDELEKRNRTFSQKYRALRFHYFSHKGRSHTSRKGDDNFCDICTKIFTSKEILDGHIPTHFENYNSICFLCSEDCHDRNGLIQHIPTHVEANINIDHISYNDDVVPGDSQTTSLQNEPNNEEVPINQLPRTETWNILAMDRKYPCKATCKSCPNFTASSYALMMLHEKMTYHVQTKFGKSGLEYLKYECAICSARYKKALRLRHHFKTKHIEQKIDVNERSNVCKMGSGKKNMKCHMCFEMFSSEETFDNHIKNHFQMISSKCELCKEDFPEREDLIKHLPIHDSAELQCDLCELCFSTEDELRIHRMGYHKMPGEKRFPCVHCTKVFQTKKGVNAHIKRIHIDKVYECEHCGQCFQNKDTLLTHTIFIHTKDFPFPCQMCEKGFRVEGLLNKHIEDHHAIDKILCNICGLKFTVKWQLHKHMQEHDLEERKEHSKLVLVCEICGKKFLRHIYLKQHLDVHAGKKPFQCEICGRYFGRIDNLRTHMRTHTGQKPYCCDACGKQFARVDNLNTHKRKMHP